MTVATGDPDRVNRHPKNPHHRGQYTIAGHTGCLPIPAVNAEINHQDTKIPPRNRTEWGALITDAFDGVG